LGMEGIWFTELETPGLVLGLKLKKVIHQEKTSYQSLAIVETEVYGKALILDETVQTTLGDEYFYHEMIVHVPLHTHPFPQRILVIGGGDGGSIREVVKYPQVKEAVLVEIDERVVVNALEHLPELSSGLKDPRVKIVFADGISYVAEQEEAFDVIIVDSTDPIGPAAGLFSPEFYRNVFKALAPEGIFVSQTGSPLFAQELLKKIHKELRTIFPITRLYLTTVPTYPGGWWSFTLGSKKHDPLEVNHGQSRVPTRFYTPAIHRGAFNLPPFIKEFLNEG